MVTNASTTPEKAENLSPSVWESLYRAQDDLEALKYSHVYNRDDELRRSTGSIYGPESPTKSKPQPMHVRSNSDTSEINVLVGKDLADGLIREPRSPTGESFFALIRKFEQNIQNEKHLQSSGKRLWHHENENQTYVDGFRGKSGASSASSSPLVERRTPLLKRKNSLRNNAYLLRVFKGSGEAKVGDDEYGDAPSRKYFAHYDCRSIAVDFEDLAQLYAKQGDGPRRKNTRSGASAASAKVTAATMADKMQRRGSDSSTGNNDNEASDIGDSKTNDLVESCPYFRNELGGEEEQDPQIALTRGNMAFQNPHDPTRPKEPKLDLHKRRSTLDILLTAYDSARRGNLSSGTGVTILDNSKPESGTLYLGEGFHNEDGRVFEHVDHGSYYYKNFFVGQEHLNYLGIDERFGPVALSLKREKLDERNSLFKSGETEGNQFQYRIIIRTSELTTLRGSIMEEAIPSTSRHGAARALPAKDILEHVAPELQLTALRMAQPGVKVPEQLMKLDEQGMTNQYKVGVLYCKDGQSTEEQMYNNQTSGPAFDEFLDLIGTRITLKGFEGYRAQLDNRNDSTGECSVYTQFHGREIMFHVSTLLPWTPNNRQQLLRKRHIGNDIVTIVFQEPGAVPFTPKNIRSHFQHVFIVVRVFNPCSDNTYYRVAVSRSKDVPPFGPTIPAGAKFGKQKAFADFLLTKVINAENAAHKSEKFSAMATRTRHEYLKDLATNSVTNTTLETGAKSKGILRSKKKDKVHPPICAERVSRGALVWNVQVEDYRNSSMIECKMGISADTMVLVHSSSKEVLFSIPTKSVIGWTPLSESIKVFYGSGDCLVLNVPMSSSDDIPEIVRRLEEVSIGCQTQTMTLRRNNAGQLGFHVQYEGLIADVEPSGYAWQAGLRQGCRLVEINGKIVATLNHDQMIDILRKPGSVSVVMVPPFQSGKPRKGIQPSGGSYWGYSRSSVATISSHSSASSVAEEQESREHSAASSSSVSAPDSGWKQPSRMASKNSTKGKDSPWIMRGGNTPAVDARTTYSVSRPPDPPASPGASSSSSVSGSSSTLHETPRHQPATYGASYTVTTITPNEERQKHGSQEIYPVQSALSSDKPKWSGLITLDSEPRPSKSLGVTLTAHTASGTLYAIASGPSPSSPSPLTPETPIFGSTSQRPETRHRRAVLNGQEERETFPWQGGVMQDEKSSAFRVNVEPVMSATDDVEQRECGDPAAESNETKVGLPFKETSLGAVITTVNTYTQKQSLEDITDASMSETVDQIERAFGFKTPEMIGNGSGSLERNGSVRRKSGDRISVNSLQDIHLTRRTQSGDSLNVPRSSEDDEISGDILDRLSQDLSTEQEEKVYFREYKIQQRSSEGDIHRLKRNGATTVVDASPTTVEVKKDGTRKSEFEARMAARNLIIERLENHKQALGGDAVEGIKIYHAKSRSTPAETQKNAAGEKPSKGRQTSQDDMPGRLKGSADRDGGENQRVHHHSRRRKPSDSSNKPRTPEVVHASKPVVRSERKIRLSSSTTPVPPNGDKSQTVPRSKSNRRQRHVSKQMAAVAVGKSDSSEDESRPFPRQRVTRGGDSMDTNAVVTAKSRLSPDRNRKASSLPRELESGAKPLVSDSRSRRPHASHLKGARITKIKMSASDEPNDSIVDQTSRLLNASQAVRYDQGSSLVIAEDVLKSLTRASDLLHHQSSSREERDKDRREKDKSLSRIKAPGRGRSHGPHKFYIPVVPRRHSFDERIFALPSAKGNSGESLLTRESIGKEAELEMKLAIVSNALMKEGEEKHRMDSELRKLQKENRRLQEDLRTASQQLRKFTEWFFSSVEPSNS